MNLLVYILVYPLIWLISILPFKILYFISDGIYLLLYHVVGYRKKVVYKNLKLVFPEKSNEELIAIQKKFYHHFVDIFIEMIKSFTIAEKELDKRFIFKNIDLLNTLYTNKKSTILVFNHYANWEWIIAIAKFLNYKCFAAYTKVKNTYFDHQILNSRERFGVKLLPTSKTIAAIDENEKNNIQGIYGLLSDQSPQLKKTHYWSSFLGIKVPIHTGAEMLAKKYDMNLVFADIQKVKRGYYECTFSLISDDAKKYADYKLTDIYLEKLEKQVRLKPEFYFWTHNRFKHMDKTPKS